MIFSKPEGVRDQVERMAALYSQFGAWDETRVAGFTAALSGLNPSSVRVAIGRWARTATKAPLPGDIRALCEQLPVIEDGERDPHRKIYHPGEGIGGNRPAVVPPDWRWNARLRAQYLRRATETAEVLRVRRDEARVKRARGKGDPQKAGDILWPAVSSLMRRWLARPQRCDWCCAPLTEANIAPYLEFCRDLGQHRPLGTPTPEPRVFCGCCAPGAISELVDGIEMRHAQ